MCRLKYFSLLLGAFYLASVGSSFAATNLKEMKKKYDQQIKILESAETNSAKLRSQIEAIKKNQKKLRVSVGETKSSLEELEKNLELHKKQLSSQIRHLQRHAYMSDIFSLASATQYATEFNRRARYRHYYEALKGSHIISIHSIESLKSHEIQLTNELAQEQTNLKDQEINLKNRKVKLDKQRKLALITSEKIKKQLIKNKKLKHYALGKSRKRLRKEIVNTQKKASLQKVFKNSNTLAARKRSIPWPSTGNPTKISHFDNAWRLKQNAPQQVMSIAAGKVVSIQWLPNLGNTIIIDHGNKYRGVYAQVDTSYVKVGDIIKNGDKIGLSGGSPSQEDNGMIFILLRNAQQLNLNEWLSSS